MDEGVCSWQKMHPAALAERTRAVAVVMGVRILFDLWIFFSTFENFPSFSAG